MMKIGILTQALHGNYGGILQNYALQEVLRQMGHRPITIDRHILRKETPVKRMAKWGLQLLHSSYDFSLLTNAQRKRLNQNQLEFVRKHISTTGVIYSQDHFDSVVSDPEYDAFIVGSDQCWRLSYSANISNYFLDFAIDRNVKRVAYAASFGVDTWELNQVQSIAMRSFAQKISAISVRESSGVDLCRKYLGVNAEWVVDPTMLLGVEGFRPFVVKDKTGNQFITQYLLENSIVANQFVLRAKELSGINDVKDNNRSSSFKRFKSLAHYENIPVEEWITNIANAKLVVTDSFHGAVFAIMFNIPFIVKLNDTRGNTRLESLLSDFELENCLFYNADDIVLPEIDWSKVNKRLKLRQEESKLFLETALK